MKTYTLTAFEKDGKKVLDESFTAKDDEEAKETGRLMLFEKGFSNHVFRCVTSDAKLILFNN